MKSSLFSRTILLSLIFLVACQAQTPTVIPVPPVTAAIIPSPSPVPPPTATPDPEIISPENASQLLLKFINMGSARGFQGFSPDGKWLYQASTAGTFAIDAVNFRDVHLLASTPSEMLIPDAQTFSEVEALTGFVVYQQSIFSPDGSLVAGYFRSDLTTVWRLADGKLINQFDGQPEAISPDNRLIITSRSESFGNASDGFYTRDYIDLYDLQTGEQIGSWGVRTAFFLSDNRLAVESADGYTRIFDPVTRKVPHAFAGWYATFSPDEQKVAVLYGNHIHVYQVSDGKFLRRFDSGLPSTDTANLQFSTNGEILAVLSTEYYCCDGYSNRLFVWKVSDGLLLADLSRAETLGQFEGISPDGQTILINSRIIRISDGSLIKELGTYFIDSVTNLGFTADGRKLIVLDTNGHVYLYTLEGKILDMPQDADRVVYLPFLQPASGISSKDAIDVPSPAGKWLARRNMGMVTISNISNPGESIQIPVSPVKCFTFSPDGKILALGLPNGSVQLWDVYGQQKTYTLPPQNTSSVSGLAFSPDGKLLAVGVVDGTVRLYGLDAR